MMQLYIYNIIVTIGLYTLCSAQFSMEPKSVVQAKGLEAEFQCLYPGALLHNWVFNGNTSITLPDGAKALHETVSTPARLFIPALPQYNNLVVQCEAIVREGHFQRFILSENTTLRVQGPLPAVTYVSVSIDLFPQLTISWSAPFSLDLTTADPDIQYCVEVYNVTGGGSHHLDSVCGITDTQYTYTAPDPTGDCVYGFTVTPRSNIQGSLNGTTSQPVEFSCDMLIEPKVATNKVGNFVVVVAVGIFVVTFPIISISVLYAVMWKRKISLTIPKTKTSSSAIELKEPRSYSLRIRNEMDFSWAVPFSDCGPPPPTSSHDGSPASGPPPPPTQAYPDVHNTTGESTSPFLAHEPNEVEDSDSESLDGGDYKEESFESGFDDMVRSSLKGSDNKRLSDTDLATALRLLRDSGIDFREFGSQLSVPYERLEEIEKQGLTPNMATLETVREWLRQRPTWKDLISALKKLRRRDLAERVLNELSLQGIEVDNFSEDPSGEHHKPEKDTNEKDSPEDRQVLTVPTADCHSNGDFKHFVCTQGILKQGLLGVGGKDPQNKTLCSPPSSAVNSAIAPTIPPDATVMRSAIGLLDMDITVPNWAEHDQQPDDTSGCYCPFNTIADIGGIELEQSDSVDLDQCTEDSSPQYSTTMLHSLGVYSGMAVPEKHKHHALGYLGREDYQARCHGVVQATMSGKVGEDVNGDYLEDQQVGDGPPDYDPHSVMHYWFDAKWLKNSDDGRFSEEKKDVIFGNGIYKRSKYSAGAPADRPSSIYRDSLEQYYRRNSDPPTDSRLIKYVKYLEASYRRQAPPSVKQFPPVEIRKVLTIVMIEKEEIQPGKINEDFVRMTITGRIDDVLKHKTPIKLQNIYSENKDDKSRLVIIEGAPGMGKSTLSLPIVKEWARGVLYQEYTVVVRVELRDAEVKKSNGLADLLPCADAEQAFKAEEGVKEVLGEGVLVVLDGWDEHELTSADSITNKLAGKCQGSLIPNGFGDMMGPSLNESTAGVSDQLSMASTEEEVKMKPSHGEQVLTQSLQRWSTGVTDKYPTSQVITTLTLEELVEQLHPASTDWYFLGLNLGLNKDKLDAIEKDRRRCDDALEDILKEWLRTRPDVTWDDVCEALEKPTVKRNDVALKIRNYVLAKEKVVIKQLFTSLPESSLPDAQGTKDRERYRIYIRLTMSAVAWLTFLKIAVISWSVGNVMLATD